MNGVYKRDNSEGGTKYRVKKMQRTATTAASLFLIFKKFLSATDGGI